MLAFQQECPKGCLVRSRRLSDLLTCRAQELRNADARDALNGAKLPNAQGFHGAARLHVSKDGSVHSGAPGNLPWSDAKLDATLTYELARVHEFASSLSSSPM